MRIYRQPSDGDWERVVGRVVEDLRQWAGAFRGKSRGATTKPNLWKTLLSKKRMLPAMATTIHERKELEPQMNADERR